ncbi:MAG: coenzyme F420-0:L-glutamate ligase / coenzyme F420-1:gamma-L-glutamate ligase [Parcubacteria bacterium C7867-001]|nr:MAG: coenzyme F420-0:L-glutamate ligase / coenzyme F420-1:gamma-L-glutamate ligase [Parcubacteria bacterium C7867-001]
MQVLPVQTHLYKEGENLETFIAEHIPRVKNGSIVVVTSKIAALAERRTLPLPSEREEAALMRRESSFAIKTKWVWLTLKDGMIMANAGADKSNAAGKMILLPKDSFASAARLRRALMKHYRISKLGVLITDSRVAPLRAGVIGVALGYAGFKGVKDYRGKKDLFGRPFVFEQTNVADNLASAAILVMGEGAERIPLALIENAPVEWTERVKKDEGRIPPEDDLYLPFLGRFAKKRI